MAVGFPVKANYVTGDVLSAANMNDLSGSVNLLQSAQYAAGKNKIINGDFGVWQRGTSFTPTTSTYSSDRWAMTSDGSGATRTISRQTFTLGTAPVSGYEGQFFLRYNQSVAGTGGTGNYLYQRIEDVRTFAGQTVTLSFWAKADAARTVSLTIGQLFGTGGSPSSQVDTSLGSVNLTTSWVRYSATAAIPSIASKTIGTDVNSSSLQVLFTYPTNATMTIDLWGVQLEAGSTASPFQTATGTIQNELAACQRYYYRIADSSQNYTAITVFHDNSAQTSTIVYGVTSNPVPMRTTPTSTEFSNIAFHRNDGTLFAITAVTIDTATDSNYGALYSLTVSGVTAGNVGRILGNNNSGAYFAVSAEL